MKSLLKLLLIILFPLSAFSQVTVQKTDSANIGSILQFYSPTLLQNVPVAFYSIAFPPTPQPVVIPPELAEDTAYGDQDDTTYDYVPILNYGTVLNTNLQMANGSWQDASTGKVWTLKISIKKVYNTSVHIDSFCLSPTASFYILSGDLKFVKGPFTKEGMEGVVNFGTFPMDGNSCYLFLYEPDNNSVPLNHFTISAVVGGYQPVGDLEPPTEIIPIDIERPDPTRCISSIRCYPAWMQAARAVSRWTNGEGSACSGTLLNNENFNGIPFYYSAQHCLPENPNLLVRTAFQFQFWQTGCNTGVVQQGIEFFGATLLHEVGYNSGDAILLRLNTGPGVGDRPTYAGWSRQNSNPARNSCGIIHHPRARDMRFTQGAVVRDFLWDWDFWKASYTSSTGLVLPGSSGSALFNGNRQVIGSLSRGFPQTCFFRLSGDRYGKFHKGWSGMQQFLSPVANNFSLDGLYLNPLQISGNAILTCASDNTYSVPNLDGCTFTWTVSPNLAIMSGTGTHRINVRYIGSNPQSDICTINIVIIDSKGSIPNGRRATATLNISSGSGALTGEIVQAGSATPLVGFNIIQPNAPAVTGFSATNATSTTAVLIGGSVVWNFTGGPTGHLYILANPGESATFRLTASSGLCGSTSMDVVYAASFGRFDYKITPNPAGNNITITPEKIEAHGRKETGRTYTVTLIDVMTGAQVKKVQVQKGEMQKQIDVSALKRGHYAVQIIEGANVSTQRLLLQ